MVVKARFGCVTCELDINMRYPGILSFTTLVDTRMATMFLLFNLGACEEFCFLMGLAVGIFTAKRDRFLDFGQLRSFKHQYFILR